MRQRRNRIWAALCFSLVIMTACSGLFPTPIREITANPRTYADKQVWVSGTVEETFSLVVVKYFTISDGTGELVVITQKTLPAKGEKIKVRGKVRDAFSLGDQHLLVLMEDGEDSR